MTSNIKNAIQSLTIASPLLSAERVATLRPTDKNLLSMRSRALNLQGLVIAEIAPAIRRNQERFDSLGC